MFETVMPIDDLWEGEMKRVTVANRPVLLLKVAGQICAYADRCAHLGLPLSTGALADGVITCREHHFQYRACNGHGVNPKNVRLTAYSVRVEDGMLAVDVDAPHSEGS